MALREDNSYCTNTAKHTQRVWSVDRLREQGLAHYAARFGKFNFADKKRKKVVGDYVPAPFFDQTVLIEEGARGVEYIPVCNTCFQIPFKDETYGLYHSLVQGSKVELPSDLVGKIEQFLEMERWVTREEGKVTPIPFYRNRVGGFS